MVRNIVKTQLLNWSLPFVLFSRIFSAHSGSHTPFKMPISHSPKENLLDISLTPTSRTDQSKKRKPEEELERSNNDLFTYLENMSMELSNELKTVKGSMSSVQTEIQDMKNDFLTQLNTKFNQINVEMENMNEKISNMNDNVNKNTTLAEQNQRFINAMQQENLINKMEIVGATIDKSKRGDDLKAEVIKIINSYDIAIKTDEIKYASVRQINSKDKVCLKKSEELLKYIESEKDLEETMKWEPNVKKSGTKRMSTA